MNPLKCLRNKHVLTIFRWILGVVFIYTSIPKIIDSGAFLVSIQNYRILPHVLAQILAVVLPWTEFIAGFLLITRIKIRIGSLLISGMLCMFIIAIGSVIIRKINIDCGCQLPESITFFDDANLNLIVRFFEDIILLAMSISVLKFTGKTMDRFR